MGRLRRTVMLARRRCEIKFLRKSKNRTCISTNNSTRLLCNLLYQNLHQLFHYGIEHLSHNTVFLIILEIVEPHSQIYTDVDDAISFLELGPILKVARDTVGENRCACTELIFPLTFAVHRSGLNFYRGEGEF